MPRGYRMKLFGSLAVASALAFTALGVSTPANAVITTYAQYQQLNGSQKLVRYALVGSGAGTGNRVHSTSTASTTAFGAAAVNFQFTIPAPPELSGNFPALMTLDASTVSRVSGLPNTTGAAKEQNGFNGYIQFNLAAPIDGKSLLLRLDFTNARITSTQGGTQMSFGGSTGGGTVITPSSDFLDFTNVLTQDFGISIVALNPTFLANDNSYGRTTRGSGTGNFSSDPAPFLAVPEPESWALMLFGFGIVGAAVRRRSAMVRVVA